MALNKFQQFRRSKHLVTFTFFLAQVTDDMSMTLLQSLAPALIKYYEYVKYTVPALTNSSSVAYSKSQFQQQRFLEARNVDGNVSGADAQGNVYYCEKHSSEPQCFPEKRIMQVISPMVGYLATVGPCLQIIFNPIIGIVCSKIGHRLPFMIGAVFQTAGGFMFLFAPNTPILFIGRGIQAITSDLCCISGLVMVGTLFTDAAERAKVLMLSLASSFPVAALLSFFVGNTGYDICGFSLPFGILVALSILDGVLRFVLDTSPYMTPYDIGLIGVRNGSENLNEIEEAGINGRKRADVSAKKETDVSKNEETTPVVSKQRKGTYSAYLTDWYILIPNLMVFTEAFAFNMSSLTAPNWLTNVLHGKQWQLGVLLGVASIFQLAMNIFTGIIVTNQTTWLMTFIGFLSLTIGLVVYPLCTDVWQAVVPEILIRVAHGLSIGLLSNFISSVAKVNYGGETAKAFTLYVGCCTLGAGVGPLFAGLLLKYMPFMVIYYSVAVVAFGTGFGTFLLRRFHIQNFY
ncbi:chromaffin granule amine transporter-like [Lineus longissimus]|uniref:chromaffin granule amine transporter-like n=1 Tax=Lineus longissimus TaxID=88925 RepID=UPI00315DDFE5